MINNWMRFVFAILVLPFCFFTEAFIITHWLHLITVSWWWIIYAIGADTSNGFLVRRLIFGKDEKLCLKN